MRFENKVVIVTGAASGIGAATAELFAKEGASVVAVDMNKDDLSNVVRRCNGCVNGEKVEQGATHNDNIKTIMIVANIAKDDEPKRIIEETIRKFGKLDILVNGAGIFRDGKIIDGSLLKTFDDVLNVNFVAVVKMTTLAAPHLIKTKGNVVNISSIKAVTMSTTYAYDLSKVAIDGFTTRAALELGPVGVRVNALRPGPVRTGLIKNARIAIDMDSWKAMTVLDRISEPEDIAEHILFLASDKAKCITGSVFTHDNGTLAKYSAS